MEPITLQPETAPAQILVVDDDMNICSLVQDILESEGYRVHIATQLCEAREFIRYEPYDLIITDMYFGTDGGTNGLDLVDFVCRQDETIPVILITGFPSISHAVDAMKRGAEDFLTKPFDRNLLLHKVARAINERRLRCENQRLQAEVNKTAVIEKLNRELDHHVTELTQLYTISEGLNDFMESRHLFNRIAELTRKVTGAQRISVMVFDRARQFLKIRAAIGVPETVVSGTVIRTGDGIAGLVASKGEVIRMTKGSGAADTQIRRTGAYKTFSFLSLPLKIAGDVFGVINLTDKLDGSDFTRYDEQIMQNLVEKASIKLENQALYEGLYSNLLDTLNSLVTTIEAKDPYTREHSQRVTDYALALARHMQLSDDQIEMVGFAGMLHDIGKIGVHDEILTKAGRLTDGEYDLIKLHPVVGERIVTPLGLVADELSIIRSHHERYDGRGYPDGLRGLEIPLLARVVAVTDAFDAMTTTRSYRKAMDVDHALREMAENSGTQFDPDIVRIWIDAVQTKQILFQETVETTLSKVASL